jgi:hypothetical protein
MNLKSSSGFLADVSLPVLFGSLQPLISAWKAVETETIPAASASSLHALLKWWCRLSADAGQSLSRAILHALQLSAAHTSCFIMRGGALWAWLLKLRPALVSFMSLAHRTLAVSDVEEDIFAMIAAPMHAMADVCDALVLLGDLGAVPLHFVVATSAIMQSIQNQLEVLLSYPPSFSALSVLKLSWVQVCKVSFVSPIPPPPGLLQSPPLSNAVSSASFVPDCISLLTVIDSDIRIVFPCWPWVLHAPASDATLEVDSNSSSECASTALLNLSGIGSLHLLFYSKVLEKSWSELVNQDGVHRATACAAEEAEWKISCSIADTEQRNDLIREYTAYIIRVAHGRLEWLVSRRFSDFEHLVKQLRKELPAWAFAQLLPLPSAKSVGQNLSKNSFAVVEKRRIQLELYLADVCSRRIACKSSCFRKFLDFQSHFHETFDSKSNAPNETNSTTSPALPSSPSIRSAAAAIMAFSTTGRRASLSVLKSRSMQAAESSEASPDTSRGARMTSVRRFDVSEHSKPVVVEPAMYSVLYKRGGFHNAGFLHKSSWKNKAVAIWRGVLAYWPAAEDDKTRLEPLHHIGNPTSVVNLVGARITNFAERPNSFEIHVTNGVITFAAHSSEMFAAWLSCLVSCIVPSSEAFIPPNISTLLGLAPAPHTPPPPSFPIDASPSTVESPKKGKSELSTSWFCFPLFTAKESHDIGQLLLLVAAVQALLEQASPTVFSSMYEALAAIDGETYSVLRGTATGRTSPDASWIRLRTLVSEAMQEVFQQLLSRVSAISAIKLQPHYALTTASCPYGVAAEAVAIVVCLRAYLDEQGQPLLLPDDCDASQLTHPQPVIDFLRALLNMSFIPFFLLESASSSSNANLGDDASAAGNRSSLPSVGSNAGSTFVLPLAASGNLAGLSSKRSSLGMAGKRGSGLTAASASPAAVAGNPNPIISFLASSMCRSTHGMFAEGDGGSIRHVAQLHRQLLKCVV